MEGVFETLGRYRDLYWSRKADYGDMGEEPIGKYLS